MALVETEKWRQLCRIPPDVSLFDDMIGGRTQLRILPCDMIFGPLGFSGLYSYLSFIRLMLCSIFRCRTKPSFCVLVMVVVVAAHNSSQISTMQSPKQE